MTKLPLTIPLSIGLRTATRRLSINGLGTNLTLRFPININVRWNGTYSGDSPGRLIELL